MNMGYIKQTDLVIRLKNRRLQFFNFRQLRSVSYIQCTQFFLDINPKGTIFYCNDNQGRIHTKTLNYMMTQGQQQGVAILISVKCLSVETSKMNETLFGLMGKHVERSLCSNKIEKVCDPGCRVMDLKKGWGEVVDREQRERVKKCYVLALVK